MITAFGSSKALEVSGGPIKALEAGSRMYSENKQNPLGTALPFLKVLDGSGDSR